MRTALIAGATGLIGSQLLNLLLAGNHYSKVIAISRYPLASDPKLVNIVADFPGVEQFSEKLVADDIFCCLGTTMKKAKSKDAFRKIDFDYPVALARIALQNGAKQFLLVSALGADPDSAIFYNKIKGETEKEILKTGFESVHIVRPSLLLGSRTEHRATEQAAIRVYKILNFIIPRKFKAIDSARVARALQSFAVENKKGEFIYESASLQSF
jgi:uncharacterized protein YbjT (DUF2867 family)